MASIDLSAAFDLVNIKLLIKRLHITGLEIRLRATLLKGRVKRIKKNERSHTDLFFFFFLSFLYTQAVNSNFNFFRDFFLQFLQFLPLKGSVCLFAIKKLYNIYNNVILVGRYNGLECYNNSGYYIGFNRFNRFNILLGSFSILGSLNLGHTERRRFIRFTSRAAFCAAHSVNYLNLNY
jgi:hypothetical protein